MKVGVARESAPGERRVALVPEALGKLTAAGLEILVERDAGSGAAIPDSAYAEAGATIVSTADLYGQSDVILRVQKPSDSEVKVMHQGQAVLNYDGTIDAFIEAVYNVPTLSETYKYAAYDGLQRLARRSG